MCILLIDRDQSINHCHSTSRFHAVRYSRDCRCSCPLSSHLAIFYFCNWGIWTFPDNFFVLSYNLWNKFNGTTCPFGTQPHRINIQRECTLQYCNITGGGFAVCHSCYNRCSDTFCADCSLLIYSSNCRVATAPHHVFVRTFYSCLELNRRSAASMIKNCVCLIQLNLWLHHCDNTCFSRESNPRWNHSFSFTECSHNTFIALLFHLCDIFVPRSPFWFFSRLWQIFDLKHQPVILIPNIHCGCLGINIISICSVHCRISHKQCENHHCQNPYVNLPDHLLLPFLSSLLSV